MLVLLLLLPKKVHVLTHGRTMVYALLWWWWWCVCDGAEASPNAAGRRRVSAEILLRATRLMGFLTLVVSTWVCVPSNWLFPG